MASVSAEAPNPVTVTRSSASEPSITARWLTDLSPGTVSSPVSAAGRADLQRGCSLAHASTAGVAIAP